MCVPTTLILGVYSFSVGKWGEVERCYVAALKAVFRRLRWEREAICRYFHKRKYVKQHLQCI